MTQFFDRLNEGGPFFMYPIFLVLILIIILTVKGILNKDGNNSKTTSLISSLGILILAWGILGQTIGLITAFDAIEAIGDISTGMLAGGLKVSLLTTVFGIVTFIVSRIGLLILTLLKK